ncbi:hypothetical protein B0T10DRAFT_556209 [Thelonectria olida]|uniref:DUF7707 domain-containing protein n=1 Tax=Thelonectria olida TaxID=1576542 RepID=A0A9P8WHA5_9HYPO|nr:hypothetical protein B0T10DRAFT_556209 [Thelonectria olida]
MRFSLALLAVAASTASAAVAEYDSSLNMTINANEVDAQTRATWCQAQTNSCTSLCDDSTDDNSCTQTTLAWECTCSSNHSAPALQYYTQTVPTFICEQLYSDCIAENTGSASGQKECKTNIKALCGTQEPSSASSDDDDDDESSSTTAGTATATSAGSTASASDESVTSTSSDGLAAPTMAPGKGAAAAVAIGMLAYLV